MAQSFYPTNTLVNGPFLFEREALKRLDSILDEHWSRLVENHEEETRKELDSAVAEWQSTTSLGPEMIAQMRRRIELKRPLRRRRVVTINFADGRTLRVKSFEEAFSHAEIIAQLPVAFTVRVTCGEIELRLETSDSSGPRLNLQASPSENETVQDLFGDLKSWLRTVAPSKWLEWWGKLGFYSVGLWFIWLMGAATILLTSSSSGIDYKSIARKIVDKGVSGENRDQAIQAILAIQAQYGGREAFHLGLAFWIFAVGGLMACVILSHPPGVVIGIGKGEHRVSFWKAWIKFVFIAIPVFVASNILAPLVVNVISKRMGH